ncbi:MFS transporter [Sphaerisporangium perillae]|uniref:MFS transporter n=1 Tax=Sphaerisporangium perillae TaxID=2935860 RepID=UPI00200C8BAD|nr:MFS transporter [Sphaerisporangium perillae]
MIVIVIAVQLAISVGFFAVMAHLVVHLRHDLGLLAGTVSLVLGLRVAAQYMLFLPAGALTDAIGPARAGALACTLRAAGFALLGTAGGLAELLLAAVVLAVGGALFHPSAQSLLAGVAPARRSRGFAAYMIAGQIGAVTGPPAGLFLLSTGGFGLLTALAVVAWGTGAALFLLLHPARATARRTGSRTRTVDVRAAVRAVLSSTPHPGRGTARRAGSRTGTITVRGPRISAVLRDRRFLLFAVTVAPTTLLADQIVSVVPLKEVGGQASTLFFCVVGMATAAVQPWCAASGRAARPWVLKSGLICGGAGYLLLLAIPSGGGPLAVLVTAGVLHGLAAGLTQPALFQTVTRRAPSGQFGTYFGLLSFLAGAVALAGGFTVGRLFDTGSHGESTALIGLAVVAALSAAAVRAPRPEPDMTRERESVPV